MRSFLPYLIGFTLVLGVWLGGFVWPKSQGYYSIIDLVKDRTNRAYSRPYDRDILRADLVAGGFRLGDAAFVRLFKHENRLELWMAPQGGGGRFKLFRTYDICKFSGELGPKLKEGDRQSPEGFYQIAASQMNPNSRHHLSFNLAFPNVFDRAHERTGTFLMIHGGCSSIGCYAVTDEKVDEIYAIVEAAQNRGQDEVPVHIFPFEMNDDMMDRFSEHRWADFWRNLKTGYDLFERDKVPPVVGVCEQTYVFNEETKQAGCQLVAGWR